MLKTKCATSDYFGWLCPRALRTHKEYWNPDSRLDHCEQGTDWTTLKKMVKLEAKKGNPIAQLIHQLKLETNQVMIYIMCSSLGFWCSRNYPYSMPNGPKPVRTNKSAAGMFRCWPCVYPCASDVNIFLQHIVFCFAPRNRTFQAEADSTWSFDLWMPFTGHVTPHLRAGLHGPGGADHPSHMRRHWPWVMPCMYYPHHPRFWPWAARIYCMNPLACDKTVLVLRLFSHHLLPI